MTSEINFIKFYLCPLLIIISLITECYDKTPKYNAIETTQAPVIDGNIDEIWNSTKIDTIKKSIVGVDNKKDDNDFTVRYRCLWDYSDIFFLFEVTDEKKIYYPEIRWYENDLVQIFFGRSLKKISASKITGGDISQYTFIYGIDSLLLNGKYLTLTNIEFKKKDINDGYIFEIKMPWKDIGIIPRKKLDIPVNFEANDLDKGESAEGEIGIRETIIGWAPNTAEHSWTQTKNYGDLILY